MGGAWAYQYQMRLSLLGERLGSLFIVYAMDINGVSSGGSMPRLRDVMRR